MLIELKDPESGLAETLSSTYTLEVPTESGHLHMLFRLDNGDPQCSEIATCYLGGQQVEVDSLAAKQVATAACEAAPWLFWDEQRATRTRNEPSPQRLSYGRWEMDSGIPDLTDEKLFRFGDLCLRAQTDLREVGEASAGRDVVGLQLLARTMAERIAAEVYPRSPSLDRIATSIYDDFVEMLWGVGLLQPTTPGNS